MRILNMKNESLKTTVALGMAGINVLPTTSEERDAQQLAHETLREQDAFGEIVGRLMVVDAEHPELHIRNLLATLSERTKGGADPMQDLRAVVKVAQPFLHQ